MSLLQNSNAISTGGAYDFTDSLRFRSSASAYLSRTFGTATDRKKFTFSFWIKRGKIGSADQALFHTGSDTANESFISFGDGTQYDNLNFLQDDSGVSTWNVKTNRLFRDISSWYHIVAKVDTTQATASDRIKIYVNGSQETSLAVANYPALNSSPRLNGATQHNIGGRANYGSGQIFSDVYITEFNFVDGQALTASDFGETDTDTGVWKPKKYTGTYGTNGFYLPMKQTTQAEGFNTVTYTGNGTNISVNRVGFQPDLIWVKNREQPDWHHLFDSVRGLGRLSSNDTANEYVDPPVQQLQSYNTDGFTYGTSSSGNASGEDYVAWCWEAGGTASSNTDGTITSSVSANTAKGFSVVTYTGNGSTGTVGHGLGSAPEMIIIKNRSQADGWYVWHQSNAAGIFGYLFLNSTDQVRSSTPQFGSTAPDSSVISLTYNTNDWANASGENYVAYCFSEVSGFSKFGTYTGNGTSQSINLGFRPAFVMWKRTDAAGNSWIIKDNTRYADNKGNLFPNATTVENTDTSVTFTDTGFDVDSALGYNGSGRVFIYMAFADTRDYQWNFDASGNKNNWTPNNINSNAPGETTYDIMSDVPTLTDEDTANYATLNVINKPSSHAVSNGNLTTAITSVGGIDSTIGVSSGKWYCEVTLTTVGTDTQLGVTNLTNGFVTAYLGQYTTSWGCITFNGNRIHNNSQSAYGSSFSNGDVGMIALDMDTGKWYCGKNGTWFNSGNPVNGTNPAHTGLTGVMKFAIGSNSSSGNHSINFGQRPFKYTPPTGYKKLNTYNLPDSSIVDGSEHFDVDLFTGNGTTRNRIYTDFKPSFVWLKRRDAANNHYITNIVTDGYLKSNLTDAETANSAFDWYSDGYDIGPNGSGATYVGWSWRASDSTAVSNTNGTITSTVSANPTAGFSVVTWTGNAVAGATIGHGLGTAPSVVITKGRSYAQNWAVYHSELGPTKWLQLNSSVAQLTETAIWNNTAPTSSVFTHGNSAAVNPNGGTNVSYCFADVEGYSKFGSYTGNGSTDGPFVYTGFRPAFVMAKRRDATGSWIIIDSSRSLYNATNVFLNPNTNVAEGSTSEYYDLLSNGFKLKYSGAMNVSGGTYIYMAFAENPFKNSLAR